MTTTVTIDTDKLRASLQRPGGIGERILQDRADRVANRARELAPGTMPAGITTRIEGSAAGLVAYVTSEHPASVYVIYGTRPHIIRPRRARALRFTAGGRTVYATVVHHPGTQANDFLGRALHEAL
ncbi:hypothetical protein OG896_24480 [Streptomyces sp. NBC_00669]|uniref:hypothetical protein n=1 Tax=Streptomyces sp. NBC_00669 TaxID=2976011 RepID=UPI002E350169|nr:hypothetical protein [Streptomyces sp. NBC_00669]